MATVEARLSELLSCWEELRHQGHPVSPEDLCCECPDLLEDLKARVLELEAMERLLDTGAMAAQHISSGPPLGVPRVEGSALGDFEILGELGRGGMGVVHRARHRTSHEI